MEGKFKVAFVLPFAFERFFQDAKDLQSDFEYFEDEVISKRDTWHFNWCKAMRSASIDITFYHLSKYRKVVRSYTHSNGIKIKSIPANFIGLLSKNEYSYTLLTQLRKDKPDIVFSVTHILSAVLDMYDILSFYCRIKKIPIITRNPAADTYDYIFRLLDKKRHELNANRKNNSARNQYPSLKKLLSLTYRQLRSNLKFNVKKRALKLSSIIVTQTEVDFRKLIDKFNITQKKIKLLPKPVDQSVFFDIPKAIVAEKLNLDDSHKYILYVSNLFETKGCEHVINVFPSLKVPFPKLKLIIIGGGPKKNILTKLALTSGIGSDVIFTGQVSHQELVYYYNLADVFVLPTKADGQPNVILEAISCNTPVISTNMPGPSDVLNDGLGILINNENEAELLNAIKAVLQKEFVINSKARAKFLLDYSLDNVGAELKIIFQEIIEH